MKTGLLIISLFFIGAFSAPYDPTLARELLRASTASYCSAPTLQTMKCGDACDELSSHSFNRHFLSNVSKSESVSYTNFINFDEKKIVFAFRGTQGKHQLLKEGIHGRAMTYTTHNIPNALATEYFYLTYRNLLRDDLLETAVTLAEKYPDFQFYFTGHSLGGALASHAVLDVSLLGIVPKERLSLYTYGSPRVGDFNLAQAIFNSVSEAYRVVHGRDLVPHLPPCVTDLRGNCNPNPNHGNQHGFLIWNSYHTGVEVFYDNNVNPNVYKICSRFEDPACALQYSWLSVGVYSHLTYLGLDTSCNV